MDSKRELYNFSIQQKYEIERLLKNKSIKEVEVFTVYPFLILSNGVKVYINAIDSKDLETDKPYKKVLTKTKHLNSSYTLQD